MTNDGGRPRIGLAIVACAGVAAWVDLGTIHRLHHSDSLIYSLISLWRWTPFYWGQDRIGMLVPLLATPIRHPLANLMAQDFLNIFTGLSAFVLMARYMLRDASSAIVGMLAAAVFLATVPTPFQAMYLIDACYGVWLVPGLAALILVETKPGGISPFRIVAAFVLMAVAHWVNFATAAILGPLVVARAVIFGPTRDEKTIFRRAMTSETTIALVLLAAGAIFGRWLTNLATPRVPTSLDGLSPIFWPDAWIGLAKNLWKSLAPGRFPLASAAAIGFGTIFRAWRPARDRSSTAWKAALVLTIAAVAIWAYSGTRYWTKINGYTYRYMIPSAMMIEVAALAIGFGPWMLALGSKTRKIGLFLAIAAMFLGAFWTFGLPSISGVRADFDRKCGAWTKELIDAKCSHLAGDYYRVWPAVFHAAIVLHERGEDRVIWAVTGRAEATESLWKRVPADRTRLAVPDKDPEAESRLQEFAFGPFVPIERRRDLVIYRFKAGSKPAAR